MVQSELIGVGLPNRTTIIALPLHNPRTSAFFQKITGMVTTRYQTQAFELCKVQKMHLLATKSQRAIKEKENGFLACKWKFQQQCARRTDKNTMKCFIEDNGFRHMKIQISEQCASQILKKERNTKRRMIQCTDQKPITTDVQTLHSYQTMIWQTLDHSKLQFKQQDKSAYVFPLLESLTV